MMPKRGIHPLINTMTLVLRNGATIQVQSILKASRPMRLQIVRYSPFEIAVSTCVDEAEDCIILIHTSVGL